MTKKKATAAEPLTDYAEDQMRRLREYVETHPMEVGLCVTASGPPLPAIWDGLAESGHVTVTWSEKRTDAWVKPS